jgi:hypothetical protein
MRFCYHILINPNLIHLLIPILILITILIITLSLFNSNLLQVKVLIRTRITITNEIQLQFVISSLFQIECYLCSQSTLDCDLLDTVQCLGVGIAYYQPPLDYLSVWEVGSVC